MVSSTTCCPRKEGSYTSEVGALIVKLTAETAQFREDLGKVKSDLDGVKEKSGSTGTALNNIGEARGGLMLVEDAVGVRLPRHLNSLIAQIPGVGAAFSVMLPIAGVAVAIKIIADLIEKHEEAKAKMAALAAETSGLTLSLDAEAHAMDNTNLKLQDQIQKLEHKPAHNYMAEAINDNIIAMDKWAKSTSEAFMKESKELEQYVGFWNVLKEELFANPEDTFDELGQSITDVSNRIKEWTTIIDAAKTGLVGLDQNSEAYASKVRALRGYLHILQGTEQEGVTYAKEMGESGVGAMAIFQHGALEARMAIQSLDDEMKAAASRKTIAGLEQNAASLQPLKDEAAQLKITSSEAVKASEAVQKHLDSTAKLATIKTEGITNDPSQKYEAEHAYNEAIYTDALVNADRLSAIATTLYKKEYAANADNLEKRKELTKNYNAEISAIEASKSAALDEVNQKNLELWMSTEEKKKSKAVSDTNATQDALLRAAITGAERRRKLSDQWAKDEEALHHRTAAQTVDAEVNASYREIQTEITAYQTRIANLDKFDKDYAKKVAEFNNKIVELTKKGKDDETTIVLAAIHKEEMDVKAAEDRMREAVATDIAHSIVMNKSLVQSFRQTGAEMAEQMIKNLILMELTGDKEKLIHAKNAYHKAFDTMAGIPPAPMWGYTAGALAFAAVMAFEQGGKIPGAGAVPIVGHGGETVVQKSLTDRVERAEAFGGDKGGNYNHNWHFAPVVTAMDAEGVDRVLAKHSQVFQRHIASTMRRMNH